MHTKKQYLMFWQPEMSISCLLISIVTCCVEDPDTWTMLKFDRILKKGYRLYSELVKAHSLEIGALLGFHHLNKLPQPISFDNRKTIFQIDSPSALRPHPDWPSNHKAEALKLLFKKFHRALLTTHKRCFAVVRCNKGLAFVNSHATDPIGRADYCGVARVFKSESPELLARMLWNYIEACPETGFALFGVSLVIVSEYLGSVVSRELVKFVI